MPFRPDYSGSCSVCGSGSTTDFKINAFLDGKRLSLFGFDAQGKLVKSYTARGTINPSTSSAVNNAFILFAPLNAYYELCGDIDPDTQAAGQARLPRLPEPAAIGNRRQCQV